MSVVEGGLVGILGGGLRGVFEGKMRAESRGCRGLCVRCMEGRRGWDIRLRKDWLGREGQGEGEG